MSISILYFIAALITFIQMALLIIKGGKEQNIYKLLMFIMCLICNVGFFTLAVASTVEEAILCNNISYIGGVFMPLCLLLTVADLCGVSIKRSIIYTLTTSSMLILGIVFTTEYTGLFYTSIGIEKRYGVTCLTKEYGLLHKSYRILLAAYVFITVMVVVNAIKEKRNFTKKTVLAMLTIILMPSMVYIAEKFFKCSVELLPFSYALVTGIHLSLSTRMKMYDMSSSVASAYEKTEEYGYITFDLKKNFMNCNSMALSMFPELENTKIDDAFEKKEDSVFYREIVRWIDLPDIGEHNEKKIKVGNRTILCTVRKIHMGMRKKIVGYSVELKDNTKQEEYIKLLNNYNTMLSKEVDKKTKHIRQMQNSIITGMATMVESRDNSTGGHIRRTSKCVKIFADALKKENKEISSEFLNNVIKAAPMHDLGKIAVDDDILRKPGKFTDEEYKVMKTHTCKGADIVAEVLRDVEDKDFVKIAINVAHFHHEKWDGNGYPQGLKGENIPLEARIMALADVFDALVSKRCYKEAFDYDKAFSIIEESLGSHFDPELGRIFIGCRKELEELYSTSE